MLKSGLRNLKNLLPKPVRTFYQIFVPSSHTRYHLAWRWYDQSVRRNSPEGAVDVRAKQFREQGFLTGRFDAEQVASFVASLEDAETVGWDSADFTRGYVLDSSLGAVAEAYNSSHRHFVLSPEHLGQIEEWLEHEAELIRDCLSSHWRVVNVKLRRSQVASASVGPNTWHNDQMPPSICKILIYLTPPGTDHGTTEILRRDGSTHRIEGPAGTWCLFRNSELEHRGIPPAKSARLVLELTVAPAKRTNLRPFCAGVNTQYPKYPWVSSG